MATLYDRAGKPVEVPDEQATAALQTGNFGLPAGRVNVLTPEGDAESLPSEHVFDAIKQGYTLETGAQQAARLEEKKYGDRPIAAGLAGIGRGLSFGLSDLALTKSGAVDPATLRGLDEHNKAASLVGEGVGVVGSAFVPGLGEATAGKLATRAGMAAERVGARALGEGLAGRIGTAAVKAGTEGSLFGIGNAISESVLGDTDLTAEKLVAGAGIGALTGGVLGGAFHAVGEGTAKALGAADVQGALQDHADKWTLKAIAGNAQKQSLKQLGEKGISGDLAKFVESEGFLSGAASAETQVERINEAVDKYGSRIGKVLDAGDAAGRPRISGPTIADTIESELVAPLESGNLAQRARAKMVQGEADIIREKGDLGFRQATGMMRGFDKEAKEGTAAKELEKADLYRKMIGIIRGETENQVEAVGEEAGAGLGKQQLEEYLADKKGYRLSLEAQKLAEGRALQLQSNNGASLRDVMVGSSTAAGAIASGHPLGALWSIGAGLGSKVLREHGPQLYASTLQKIAKSELFDGMAHAFQDQVSEKLASTPDLFGGFRNVLAQAAAHGADDLLATHVSLARSSPEYRDQMALAGFPQEAPGHADATLGHLDQLQAVKAGIDEHDKTMDAALNRFLGKQGGAAPKSAEALPRDEALKQFDAQSKKLDAISQNPNAMLSAVTPGSLLSTAAPGVAAAASATAARALQFLSAKIPKDPAPAVLPALARPWKPSDAELARWNRYVQAVNNPASVLAEMRRGTVTSESMEALQAVYPKLLQEIQAKAMEKLAGHSQPATYHQRQSLSMLMGTSMGGALDPARVAVFQQAHASAQKAKAQADAHKQAKFAEGMATSAQRIEGR